MPIEAMNHISGGREHSQTASGVNAFGKVAFNNKMPAGQQPQAPAFIDSMLSSGAQDAM